MAAGADSADGDRRASAADERAAEAEAAVVSRHVRRCWAMPGTALGVVEWPSAPASRVFLRWHYWWQAHLLDCLVDAYDRAPDARRRRRVETVARTPYWRNGRRWTNEYYDDIAWLGLALLRADGAVGTDHSAAIERITSLLLDAWSPELGGGIPWRRGDEFKNAPANGPAAILLARTGHGRRARAMADWIDANLRDPRTGLIWDGIRPGLIERTCYPYNQGVVLGAELALGPDGSSERIARLVAAVAEHLSTGGVLRGSGGGDGGLFPGILARHLAAVAADPGDLLVSDETRAEAHDLVIRSAEAAWANRAITPAGPVFGPEWSEPARAPVRRGRRGPDSDPEPEADLSVQLSAWMVLEAAAALRRSPAR